MAGSDSIYHRIFSDPLMVEQLVRGFVPDATAAGLDFATLRRVNAKFHIDRRGRARRRESDVVWRLRTASGEMIHIFLLLEFQARPDWWMAIRIQVYVGLLWQHIVKEFRLPAGSPLPAVLPIVLYNGETPWTCPTDTAALAAPGLDPALRSWHPTVRYHLIDEGRLSPAELDRRDSLVALLFRIETCRRRDELAVLMDEVVSWFRRHPGHEPLRLVFGEVVAQAASELIGSREADGLLAGLDGDGNMLAETFKRWERELLAEGKAMGLTEGKAQVLRRQIGRRFGELPPDAEALIAGSTHEELDLYLDRLWEARTLADLFPDRRS